MLLHLPDIPGGERLSIIPNMGGRSYICSPGHSEWTREGSSVIYQVSFYYASDHSTPVGLSYYKFVAGLKYLERDQEINLIKFSLLNSYIQVFSCTYVQYRRQIHERTI
jgi:hypothetical protein